MTQPIARRGHRLSVLALVAALLIGTIGMATTSASAQPTLPVPALGEITVDLYQCDTGRLGQRFHVTNLYDVPPGSDDADFPLAYSFEATYEGGAFVRQNPPSVFSTNPEGAPFTGNFTSTYTIPTTHPGTGAPLVSVELYAAIGYGGPGLGAIDNPVDSTSTVYTPDCHGSVVDGLIAALKRILLEIFGS